MLCHQPPVISQRPVSILCLQPRTSFGPPSKAWTRKHHTFPAARRHAATQEHARPSLSITCAQKQQFSSFDDMVQNSELPVLVDFYATWCGPCQVMSQTLTKVSAQMADKVKFVKIDTDKYPKVASRYAIQLKSAIAALPRQRLHSRNVEHIRIVLHSMLRADDVNLTRNKLVTL